MSSTLTLSKVEQAAVLLHLELQYGRIPAGAPDAAILDKVMTAAKRDTTVVLTKLEAFVTLRHLRVQRFRLEHDMAALEERRLRGGHNGDLDKAHRALDTDVTTLQDVIRRLWDMLGE